MTAPFPDRPAHHAPSAGVRYRWRAGVAALLLTAPTLAMPAQDCEESRDNVDQDDVLQMTEDGRIEPFQRILEKARDHTEGKLLEAKLDCVDQRYVYEIDMLAHDGQIRALKFDAVTGRHLDLAED